MSFGPMDSGDYFDSEARQAALEQAHERRISRCRSCHAKIIWFKTEAGKNMPVDADTVEPEDEDLDLEKHTVHWATCPHADQTQE
jgi:hypothetical protein